MHYGGFPCDLKAVLAVADRHGLVVLEDAAHAPGASCGARRCGTVGAIGCFSFFSNRNMPVGEGGMVVTDDDELADRLRLLRSHGMTTLTWDRHRGHAHSYDVVLFGFNYRLDEVRAAMGLVQLGRLEVENARRARVAALYREALDGVAGISMPFGDEEAQSASSHHLAVALLPEHVPVTAFAPRWPRGASRRACTTRPSIRSPPTRSWVADARLPQADLVADRVLTLPLIGHMTAEQIEAVTEGLLQAVRSPVADTA